MSWSGQCAMSALIGGRSGNRGLCAQPCRLPYRVDEGRTCHPLSLKDMCLASHIHELEEMGVSILKLEGRMKRPEYVAIVTRVYAALLREHRQPTREEWKWLEDAFSREGFTDAYWCGKRGREMFGVRGERVPEPAALYRAAKASYERGEHRKVPIHAACEIRAGCPSRVVLTDRDGHTGVAEGPPPEQARTHALTAEEVRNRLSRTGGTVFQADGVDVVLDEGLSLPASAINGLRREAAARLVERRTAPPPRRELPATPPEPGQQMQEMALTVSLAHGWQLTQDLLRLKPSVLYFPVERIGEFEAALADGKIEGCAALPRVCKDGELSALMKLLERAKDAGCTTISIQNIGQLVLAKKLGMRARGDYGLNVSNSRSLQELAAWGLLSATVSFELRYQQVRDLRKPLPCEGIVYGRLPLMLTENCLIANAQGCRAGDLRGACATSHTLTDRRGEHFPIEAAYGCRSELENSKPLFLADKPEMGLCGLTYGRLRFTTETPEECVTVYERYLGRGGYFPASYTRGLFYRGTE